MDEILIEAQAMAVAAVGGHLAPGQLQGIRRSVEQACRLPEWFGWDRKATAHAEIFALLADAAGDPVLSQVLNSGVGLSHHLMITAGPAAGATTALSRERLLASLTAGDPGAAGREMESYLRTLA